MGGGYDTQSDSDDETVPAFEETYEDTLDDMEVAWLQNLSRESTDMFPDSLCRMELAEFRAVCESWTSLLKGIHPTISTSLPSTETTSTYPTSAGTRGTLVGAPSSFEEHFGLSSDDVDFVGFLERSTSAQSITETYVDTYLRAADASTQLEASERMEDYLIDINIYQYLGQAKGDYWMGATARCRGTFPANHRAVMLSSKIVKMLGKKMVNLKNIKKISKSQGFARKTGR